MAGVDDPPAKTALARNHWAAPTRPPTGGPIVSVVSSNLLHLAMQYISQKPIDHPRSYISYLLRNNLCAPGEKAAASPENARGENLRTAWGFWDRSATRPPESGNCQALGVRRSLPFRLAAPPSSLRGPIFAHAERPPPPPTKPTPPTPQSRASINYKDGVSPRSSRHPARQFSGEQMR